MPDWAASVNHAVLVHLVVEPLAGLLLGFLVGIVSTLGVVK